jgi:hypothetical protein
MSGREPDARRSLDLARVVIAGAPFLALGVFALLEWADWGSQPDAKAEGGEKELAVWEGLITAQVAVWAVLAGVGLRAMRELDADAEAWLAESTDAWRARWRKETTWFLLLSYGVIVVLFVPSTLGSGELRNPSILTGQEWKIVLLFVVAGVAIFPFLFVLKRIQLCAAEESGWSTRAKDLERIQVLRRQLRSATASLGTVIALFVIASGALSDAVEAAGLEPLPDSAILVAGAWFTGVLAAIYLYVFTSLDARARGILERAAPLPDPSRAAADEFVASTTLRRELSVELELGGDARKNLEGLIAVFSPLAAALLSRFGGL